MRPQFLCAMIELVLLVAVSGGCDAPQEPGDPPFQTPQLSLASCPTRSSSNFGSLIKTLVCRSKTVVSRSVTRFVGTSTQSEAIPPDDVGIRRLSYQGTYVQERMRFRRNPDSLPISGWTSQLRVRTRQDVAPRVRR